MKLVQEYKNIVFLNIKEFKFSICNKNVMDVNKEIFN